MLFESTRNRVFPLFRSWLLDAEPALARHLTTPDGEALWTAFTEDPATSVVSTSYRRFLQDKTTSMTRTVAVFGVFAVGEILDGNQAGQFTVTHLPTGLLALIAEELNSDDLKDRVFAVTYALRLHELVGDVGVRATYGDPSTLDAAAIELLQNSWRTALADAHDVGQRRRAGRLAAMQGYVENKGKAPTQSTLAPFKAVIDVPPPIGPHSPEIVVALRSPTKRYPWPDREVVKAIRDVGEDKAHAVAVARFPDAAPLIPYVDSLAKWYAEMWAGMTAEGEEERLAQHEHREPRPITHVNAAPYLNRGRMLAWGVVRALVDNDTEELEGHLANHNKQTRKWARAIVGTDDVTDFIDDPDRLAQAQRDREDRAEKRRVQAEQRKLDEIEAKARAWTIDDMDGATWVRDIAPTIDLAVLTGSPKTPATIRRGSVVEPLETALYAYLKVVRPNLLTVSGKTLYANIDDTKMGELRHFSGSAYTRTGTYTVNGPVLVVSAQLSEAEMRALNVSGSYDLARILAIDAKDHGKVEPIIGSAPAPAPVSPLHAKRQRVAAIDAEIKKLQKTKGKSFREDVERNQSINALRRERDTLMLEITRAEATQSLEEPLDLATGSSWRVVARNQDILTFTVLRRDEPEEEGYEPTYTLRLHHPRGERTDRVIWLRNASGDRFEFPDSDDRPFYIESAVRIQPPVAPTPAPTPALAPAPTSDADVGVWIENDDPSAEVSSMHDRTFPLVGYYDVPTSESVLYVFAHPQGFILEWTWEGDKFFVYSTTGWRHAGTKAPLFIFPTREEAYRVAESMIPTLDSVAVRISEDAPVALTLDDAAKDAIKWALAREDIAKFGGWGQSDAVDFYVGLIAEWERALPRWGTAESWSSDPPLTAFLNRDRWVDGVPPGDHPKWAETLRQHLDPLIREVRRAWGHRAVVDQPDVRLDRDDTRWTFAIPAERIESARAALEKLERRAARLGVDAPRWSEGEPYDREVTVRDLNNRERTVLRRYIPITVVDPESAVRLDDWRFVATIDHGTDEQGQPLNLVLTSPTFGRNLPIHFRTDSATCDHCQTNRKRNMTFVVQHNAEGYKRVGRSCLADYIGDQSAARVLGIQTILRDMRATLEEAESYGSSGGSADSWVFGASEVLATAASVIGELGWTSRKEARDTDRAATADVVWNRLTWPLQRHPPGTPRPPQPTEADYATAAQVLEWARAIDPETPSDYLSNVRVVFTRGSVGYREVGIATSAVPAWRRDFERATAAARRTPNNEWYGTVGTRYGGAKRSDPPPILVEIVRTHERESNFGLQTIFNLMTPQGHEITWYASGSFPDWLKVPGTWANLTATVKRHGTSTYTKRKETIVDKGKFEKADPPRWNITPTAAAEPESSPAPEDPATPEPNDHPLLVILRLSGGGGTYNVVVDPKLNDDGAVTLIFRERTELPGNPPTIGKQKWVRQWHPKHGLAGGPPPWNARYTNAENELRTALRTLSPALDQTQAILPGMHVMVSDLSAFSSPASVDHAKLTQLRGVVVSAAKLTDKLRVLFAARPPKYRGDLVIHAPASTLVPVEPVWGLAVPGTMEDVAHWEREIQSALHDSWRGNTAKESAVKRKILDLFGGEQYSTNDDLMRVEAVYAEVYANTQRFPNSRPDTESWATHMERENPEVLRKLRAILHDEAPANWRGDEARERFVRNLIAKALGVSRASSDEDIGMVHTVFNEVLRDPETFPDDSTGTAVHTYTGSSEN